MPKVQVLVLEDEADVRDIWVEALETAGYVVRGIASGPEALARLPDLRPDVILLDMMMPDMDGFEFLARLRANPASTHVPVLILSALGDALSRAVDRKGAETLGVSGILPKPFPVSTLIEHVGRIIGPGAALEK